MSAYADALLRFAHAAGRRRGTSTEVFTLGTRLTRVTRELATRDPDAALAAVAAAVPDWSGGTRLGVLLREFLDRWGQRGAARGAVVVIMSDGWERDDPRRLGEQMRRLSLLAHRVVWVQPAQGPARLRAAGRRAGRRAAVRGRLRRRAQPGRPAAAGRGRGRRSGGRPSPAGGRAAQCVTCSARCGPGTPTAGRWPWPRWSARRRARRGRPARRWRSSADGEVVGSVSGGCVEGAVYDLAQDVLGGEDPVLQTYGYSDDRRLRRRADLRRLGQRLRPGGVRGRPAAAG